MEKIRFHFDGGIAGDHHLNFYEAARFQYAAARLVTKLMIFQQSGKFPRRITARSNTESILETHKDGSFDITILMPIAAAAAETFVTVPVGHLMSYVFERVLGKADETEVVDALNANVAVVEEMGRISSDNNEAVRQALKIIEEQRQDNVAIHESQKTILEKRIAELEREQPLSAEAEQISKIDPVRQAKLLSMAAPLVSEMATPLRKSAETLEIYNETDDLQPKRFLFLDKEMAEDVIISKVDDQMTAIRVDIVQYNKETGWGKLRLQQTSDLVTFNCSSSDVI